jgi:hypothetical protein
VYLNRPLQKLYPIELGESERKDNKVENEVNGYDNQKGKKKMNEKGRMEINEKERRVRWKHVSVVIDLGEQLRWMHDGETDLYLSHDSSRGEQRRSRQYTTMHCGFGPLYTYYQFAGAARSVTE